MENRGPCPRRTLVLLLLCMLVDVHQAAVERSQSTLTHNQQANTPFLFVIIIGGRHASTDLQSIALSWGKRVEAGVLYTNTPQALTNGSKLLQATGKSWTIQRTALSPPTTSRKYWIEMLSIMHEQLTNHPQIQWVVRSDSGSLCLIATLYKLANMG